MIIHSTLKQIHTLLTFCDAFRSQQHYKSGTAADHDGVDEDAQRLYQPHLDRVIAGGGCRRAGGRTAARFVGEEAALDAVHQHGTEAARSRLPQTKGFGEDPAQHRRDMGDVGRDDEEGHNKIADRHDRHDDVQTFDGSILAQDDDRRQRHQRDGGNDGRDLERILEGGADRIRDDLTDAAPADEARQREQHGHHRAAQLFPPLALGEDVDIIGRTTALASIQRVRLPILLGQGGLYKGGGGPQQGRDPHPEDRSGTARRNRRHDAHQIAHAHAGGGGNDQRLEGGKAVPALLFLAAVNSSTTMKEMPMPPPSGMVNRSPHSRR